jgi:hypothetical protein
MNYDRPTSAKSHDRDFHPTPESRVATDKRATLLRRPAERGQERNHLFDDVASMTYTFL